MPPTGTIRRVDAELEPDDVWRCLGPAGGARDRLAGDIEWAISEAVSLAEPASATRALRVQTMGRGEVTFDGGISARGRMLPHLMEGAEGGVFLLATAGPGIGVRVSELFAADRPVEAIVLDAAGSAIAMNVQSRTVTEIADARKEVGDLIGPCLVPGNEYWDLEGQRAVFDALPAHRIGVRLLDSLQMDPQKTQSALVPFGAELHILDDPASSPCSRCKATRCPMRLEPYAAAWETENLS
ncbi:MAG: hypothetical protein O3C10_09835 [Chloroflexi bacterium]|nr:hypothetical protein [Chloroflexota bacterium]